MGRDHGTGWAARTVVGSLLAGLAMITACSNSDDTTNDTTTGDAGGDDGGTITTTATGDTCTAPADQCALLSTSEAATALGAATSTSVEGMMGPGDPALDQPAVGNCTWGGSGGGAPEAVVLAVTYQCGLTSTSEQAYVKTIAAAAASGIAVAVPGVGDAASWQSVSEVTEVDGGDVGVGNLTVISGDAYLNVEISAAGTADDLQARSVAAAQLILSRL